MSSEDINVIRKTLSSFPLLIALRSCRTVIITLTIKDVPSRWLELRWVSLRHWIFFQLRVGLYRIGGTKYTYTLIG
jgi:hypothetical protein